MIAVIEHDLREETCVDKKPRGLVVTRLPELPRKKGNRYDNPGSDHDRCCVPPIQFDFERGIMRTLLGLCVIAGEGRVSYVEGGDSMNQILGIYRNPYKGSVKMVYRPSNGSAVEAKEFDSWGIRFRVFSIEEKI